MRSGSRRCYSLPAFSFFLVLGKSDGLLHGWNLRIAHKAAPDQSGPAVFNHDCLRRLAQAKFSRGVPVFGLIKRVAKAINVPKVGAEVSIKVFQREERGFRSVGICSHGSGGSERAVVG